MARTRLLLALLAAGATLLIGAAPAEAAKLKVGVGRADITPPTGYYMMGWVRSDGVISGQNTRLWARVIVLQQGDRKLALVAEDLNGIPGGMMAAAADADRDIGFSEQNVLDSASHTHAAPTGFYNFSTFNTVFMTINSPTDFDLTGSLDPQLYAFEVRQLALAIRRANANLGPGRIGWGETEIDNLTLNRSIEAHLYDHGIHLGYGQGSPSMDPDGPLHPIDPEVNVLRVDKLIPRRRGHRRRQGRRHGHRRRWAPVGIWSTFANHGTVNKFQFTYYNEDHHGAATHLTEAAIRRAGRVPRAQDVVDVYGNTDEGDQSSGLHQSGPAAAAAVGTVESQAFLRAWRQAGQHMQRRTSLDWRWTRMCWCGQDTPDGPVANQANFGLAEFTGSEEGRGPLFDVTRVPFEGDHLPVGTGGPQGDKINSLIPIDVPKADPMMALRVGSRMIVSIPGEMTAEMGRRVRAAVVAAATGSGVERAVISGLANEYSDYFTTPQEYDAQHYEGAATVYGRASSDALEQTLVGLTGNLVNGTPAPPPYSFDPRNGVRADAGPFPTGASSGSVVAQPPSSAARLSHPSFSWQGGPRGYDRPLDQAFVIVQRRVRRHHHRHHHHNGARLDRKHHRKFRWVKADSDLGLNILWTVDGDGTYRAEWEPPYYTRRGLYRFRIDANHYQLTSAPFRLVPSIALSAERIGSAPGVVAIQLAYPAPVSHEAVGDPPGDRTADLTARPATASGGKATILVNGSRHKVRGIGGVFEVAANPGDSVQILPGAARDQFGNANGAGLSLQG
jgi:neutral ceramidase